jgi:general secretion pathway protein D
MKQLALLLWLCISAGTAWAESGPSESVKMDFQNVDIRTVAGYVSEVTGLNFIVGPDVKGRITVVAPMKVPVVEVLGFFQSILEIHGYTTVEAGNMTKIVPAAEALSKGVETVTETVPEKPSDTIVTEVVRVRHLSPAEAKEVLSPMVSENAVILSYTEPGTLIITDSHSNIERLKRVLKVLDVPKAEEKISVQ